MVKLTKIYTRTGDKGDTGLVSGKRISKTSLRIEAIGAVDEVNAAIGVVVAALAPENPMARLLSHIQNDLFDLGADLATPEKTDGALRLWPEQTTWLEQQIDVINADLPPLTSFILPAGSAATASLHLARAITRRAERDVWRLIEDLPEGEVVFPAIPAYLNRLSDFLFIVARKTAREEGKEVLWQPGGNRP